MWNSFIRYENPHLINIWCTEYSAKWEQNIWIIVEKLVGANNFFCVCVVRLPSAMSKSKNVKHGQRYVICIRYSRRNHSELMAVYSDRDDDGDGGSGGADEQRTKQQHTNNKQTKIHISFHRFYFTYPKISTKHQKENAKNRWWFLVCCCRNCVDWKKAGECIMCVCVYHIIYVWCCCIIFIYAAFTHDASLVYVSVRLCMYLPKCKRDWTATMNIDGTHFMERAPRKIRAVVRTSKWER